MRVYIDRVIEEMKNGKVKSLVTLIPTFQTDGHYMNVILEYDRGVPASYPLSKKEFDEFEQYREECRRKPQKV